MAPCVIDSELWTAAVGIASLAMALFWLLQKPKVAASHRKPAESTDFRAVDDLLAAMNKEAPKTGRSYLVIGTGSVGLQLAECLLARGETKVRGFDVAAPLGKLPQGLEFVQGSVTDYAVLEAAMNGIDVVFATAALIRFFERLDWMYAESYRVNVEGTENIVRACVATGAQTLIQTSSSNVCVAAELVSLQMDETSPLVSSRNSPNHYGWTKAQAERIVLRANGTPLEGGRVGVGERELRSAVVRPCSAIFGPRDGWHTQQPMREGKVSIGDAHPKIDYVFVENVVWGHLLLEAKVHAEPAIVAGQAFCISNMEPVCTRKEFYDALSFFFEQHFAVELPHTLLPPRLMTFVAYVVEGIQCLTRRRLQGDISIVTPAMLDVARLSYVFSSTKAQKLLGYRPLYNLDQALQKTVYLWDEAGKP